MIAPFHEEPGFVIYNADALRVLDELEDGVADLLITDPPYSSGGMLRGDRMQDVHTKYVQTDSIGGKALATFSGDNRDQRGYGYWCALWLNELRRVLKPGSIAALFTDWRQLPATTDALQAGGFVWRGIVPWHKPNGRPTQGRWANSCEYVVWGTNGPRELDGKPSPGFYTIQSPRDRDHITEKPVDLLQQLLAVVPEAGVVIDPFMGVGTTLRAAKNLGRSAIGIEIDRHACATAVGRLAQETLAL